MLMGKIQYEGSDQFRPVSPWGYIGYGLLFAIPVVGLILLIVFAVSDRNINRRNYARSYWCVLLVALVLVLVLSLLTVFRVGDVGWNLKHTFPAFRETIESLEQAVPSADTGSAGQRKTASATQARQSAATQAPAAAVTEQVKQAPGVRDDVKKAIDSYEEFFREYAAFMKKYASSTDPIGMMQDYADMLLRYQDTMQSWSRFQDDYKLNDAEMAYYLEASVRIERMLLDVK